MFGLSPGHLLLLLLIVVLIFGTKKLRNLGEDLGSAIKGFRKGMQDGSAENTPPSQLKADPVPPPATTTSTDRPPESKTDNTP